MLREHPAAASIPEELSLFASYLAPAASAFKHEAANHLKGGRQQGMPVIFSAEEFRAGLIEIVDRIYQCVLDRNPRATHILDKHPANARHMSLIDDLLPNSRFIHIIRDGREGVVSMISANRRVGFGSGNVQKACQSWATSIKEARRAGATLGAERYMELRYEDLVGDTVNKLSELFHFCGLPITPEEVELIAQRNHISVKQVSQGDRSLNALRGTPGAIWKNRLTLEERYIMDRSVGKLLRSLNYAEPGWWALHPFDHARIRLYQLRRRVQLTLGNIKHIWFTSLTPPVE
jgi:hypothetical protein